MGTFCLMIVTLPIDSNVTKRVHDFEEILFGRSLVIRQSFWCRNVGLCVLVFVVEHALLNLTRFVGLQLIWLIR